MCYTQFHEARFWYCAKKHEPDEYSDTHSTVIRNHLYVSAVNLVCTLLSSIEIT